MSYSMQEWKISMIFLLYDCDNDSIKSENDGYMLVNPVKEYHVNLRI